MIGGLIKGEEMDIALDIASTPLHFVIMRQTLNAWRCFSNEE